MKHLLMPALWLVIVTAGSYPLAFRATYCQGQPIWRPCVASPLGH